jgi:hypothetical protein
MQCPQLWGVNGKEQQKQAKPHLPHKRNTPASSANKSMPTQQPYGNSMGPKAPSTPERAVSLTKAAVHPLAGLQPPTLDATGQFVSGKDIERLRLQSKRTRHAMQEKQVQQSMWTTHAGTNVLPNPTPLPQKWHGKMCPSGIATSHPAGELLQEWAQMGCLTKMGRPWSNG